MMLAGINVRLSGLVHGAQARGFRAHRDPTDKSRLMQTSHVKCATDRSDTNRYKARHFAVAIYPLSRCGLDSTVISFCALSSDDTRDWERALKDWSPPT